MSASLRESADGMSASTSTRSASGATTEDRLRHLLVSTLHLDGLDPASIPADQPLFGDGLGLDSVDALELVVGLEREFSITVPSEEVGRDAFASLRALGAFVDARVREARSA